MKGIIKKAAELVGGTSRRVRGAVAAAGAAVALVAGEASAQVTLPSPLGEGVTMSDYIEAGGASIGSTLGTAILWGMGFMVIVVGFFYMRRFVR